MKQVVTFLLIIGLVWVVLFQYSESIELMNKIKLLESEKLTILAKSEEYQFDVKEITRQINTLEVKTKQKVNKLKEEINRTYEAGKPLIEALKLCKPISQREYKLGIYDCRHFSTDCHKALKKAGYQVQRVCHYVKGLGHHCYNKLTFDIEPQSATVVDYR